MKDIKLRILNDNRENKNDPVSLTGNMTGRDVLFKSDLGTFLLVHQHEAPPSSFAQILTFRYYDIPDPDLYMVYSGLPWADPEAIRVTFYFQNPFLENSISCWLHPSILNKTLLTKYSKPEQNIFPGDATIYNYKLDISFGLNVDNSIQIGKIETGDLFYLGVSGICQEPIRLDIILLSSDPNVFNSIRYNDYYSYQLGLGYIGGTGGTGGVGGTVPPGLIFPPGAPGTPGLITDVPNSKLHFINRTGGTGGAGGHGFI